MLILEYLKWLCEYICKYWAIHRWCEAHQWAVLVQLFSTSGLHSTGGLVNMI